MKSSCIDTIMLARYIEGRITDEDRELTERHFSECDACRQDFLVASSLIADEDIPDPEPILQKESRTILQQLKHRLKEDVAALCEWIRVVPSELAVQPWFPYFESREAFSPVRSAADTAPDRELPMHYAYHKKTLNDLEAEIYIRKTADENASMKVRVTKGDDKAKNVRITLKQEGIRDVSRPLQHENVLFENLIFGNYHLVFIWYGKNQKQIYHFQFRLDETGISEKNDRF
ncbi:MAG TPA: hypothetical protein ENK58_01985 [Desulfobacterales bacterium]|nr:MAG: hypothetical protein DRI57_24820 [Deltaproteobacteria bacterium]HHC24175.1 hypothetical protein [Desulfobacterales bacterium]